MAFIPSDMSSKLNKQLDEIRQDFLDLITKINKDNHKAQNYLKAKLEQEDKEFDIRQKEETLQFEQKQKDDKKQFEDGKRRQVLKQQKESAKRIKEGEDFIRNIKPKERTENDRSREAIALLNCPVCFSDMKAPSTIWQCTQGHPVCGNCRIRISPTVGRNQLTCPTCRQDIVGRANTLEKLALLLFDQNIVTASDNQTRNKPHKNMGTDHQGTSGRYEDERRNEFRNITFVDL